MRPTSSCCGDGTRASARQAASPGVGARLCNRKGDGLPGGAPSGGRRLRLVKGRTGRTARWQFVSCTPSTAATVRTVAALAKVAPASSLRRRKMACWRGREWVGRWSHQRRPVAFGAFLASLNLALSLGHNIAIHTHTYTHTYTHTHTLTHTWPPISISVHSTPFSSLLSRSSLSSFSLVISVSFFFLRL